MLKRKFESVIEDFLTRERDKILLINGARQIGNPEKITRNIAL